MSAKVPGCVGTAFSKCEKSSVDWADQIIRKLLTCSLRPLPLGTSPKRSSRLKTGYRLAPYHPEAAQLTPGRGSCMGLSIVARLLTAAIGARGVLQVVLPRRLKRKHFPRFKQQEALLGSSWTVFCFDVPTSVPAFPSICLCSCGP